MVSQARAASVDRNQPRGSDRPSPQGGDECGRSNQPGSPRLGRLQAGQERWAAAEAPSWGPLAMARSLNLFQFDDRLS